MSELVIQNYRCKQLLKQLENVKYGNRPQEQLEPAPAEPMVDQFKLIMDARDLWAELKAKVISTEFGHLVINGQPGSGKTNVAREVYDCAFEDGFHPIYFNSFDMLTMDVEAVRQAAGHDKLFVVVDDASYVMNAISQKDASMIKNFVARIRHALKQQGKINPQICIVVIGHFTTAVPPMLKNTNYSIFSAPTNLEEEAMYKTAGRSKENRQKLAWTFKYITDVLKIAKPGTVIDLGIKHELNPFIWDVNGRLSVIMIHGEAHLYHSQKHICDKCRTIDASEYKTGAGQ